MKRKEIRIVSEIKDYTDWFCYIKPTRNIHDSGFGCFEVGYCKLGEDSRVAEKKVIGSHSDHICNWGYLEKAKIYLSMDLTLDGYIRLFSLGEVRLRWEYDNFATSSMAFKIDEETLSKNPDL